MPTSLSCSYVDTYWQYVAQTGADLSQQALSRLNADLKAIAWDEPESAIDLNNLAVLALIEAEQQNDPQMRAIHLEMALEALQSGVQQQPSHPLCMAHLALVNSMIGENQSASELAFSSLLSMLQSVYTEPVSLPLGLVYLPPMRYQTRRERLQQSLQAEDGFAQALQLLTEVLCQAQLVFYNSSGMRFLHLAQQLAPYSSDLHLKLGITNVMHGNWEGLLNLQQARKLAPQYAPTLQALYLAYRNLGELDIAEFWLQSARHSSQIQLDSLDWRWSNLAVDSPFTYVPFDQNLLMAVEPNLQSIVTIVLLSEADWFESEMEFWRNQLQLEMTVIDVGANVGVYTFSAAQQVGAKGRVIAVEPFSGCVQCLQETIRINQMDWVTVCAGAASDRPGTACLSLNAASELNELVTDESPASGDFEEVACFTLDSLIEQENLTQVNWLKIDAEGHELQVLMGSDRLISQFAPGILYENIAGSSGSNLPVAEWLLFKGYQLFRYQPYVQNLIPVSALEELHGTLNIMALPPNHPLL
jgi:FkbM family methyltransferase